MREHRSPLTTLLKKNSFNWSNKASKAFAALKTTMVTPPILGLLDFSKLFVVKCDAFGNGLGVALMQEGRPLSYLSQALKSKILFLSTYEKELLALVLAIRKWRHYLLEHRFKVKTDQQALKHFLEQESGTPFQQKWIAKLLGFNFIVEYRNGKGNKAVNALSRLPNKKAI